MKKQSPEHFSVNPALLNIVTPIGLSYKRAKLYIGEFVGRIYGVIKYPPVAGVGWLSKISNMAGTIISQTFFPADNSLLVESLSRSILQSRSKAESARDPLLRQRAEKGVQDGERLLSQIDQNGVTVGYMTNLIMPIDNDDSRFQKICQRVEGAFTAIQCKIRPLPRMQKEAFKMLSPYHPPEEGVTEVAKRLVPLSTFIGGFPFASSGYNDGIGTWFAMDAHGGMIVLDLWKRGGDRTNSNIVAIGKSGKGKSTAVKNIILSEYMMGTKIIAIDPEREYKDLCLNLGGDWINCGGGSAGKINPLQVKPSPRDEEVEADRLNSGGEQDMGDLALHMKTLEIFFSLYTPTLTEIQKALLKECLIELYASFDIIWDTDVTTISADAFPIFSDLYALLERKSKGKKNQSDYEVLAALLQDIAKGSDSFLWNGQTTIHANSKIVCLDTHDMQNMDTRIKRTQYFNILTWAWEQMSRDRKERVLLVADEAYLMIDPNVPQSLVFLRNVAKRARKYEAGIAIISQSLVDFLDPSVRMYGQPLLDMPAYKIIMGCDGKDIDDIAALYNLTDSEYELVHAGEREHALMMIGAKRLHVKFYVPAYRMEIIGSRGGR